MSHDFSEQPEGAEALQSLQPHLAKHPLVESSTRLAERHGVYSGNAAMRIGKLLIRLEDIASTNVDGEQNPDDERRASEVFERLLERYETNLLTQYEDIPKSYWALQSQIARDNGEDSRLSDERKHELAANIQDAQLTGLRTWTEYLEDHEYPMWFTVYALEGMSSLATFNKQKGVFNRRSKATVTPYPDLNTAALHKTYEALVNRHILGERITSDQVRILAGNGNFNKLYSHFMLENNAIIPTPENPQDVHGEWRTFGPKSVHALIEASQGTPWCTDGARMAGEYLQKPDSSFTMFFLQDETSGKFSKSASASIRKENGEIVELSGLKGGSKQHIEDALVPTVMEKLRGMHGGERFIQALEDKQTLIGMDKKFKAGEPFTTDELTFLYEIDRQIEHVNNLRGTDQRIGEFKQDLDQHLRQMAGTVNTYKLIDLVSEKGTGFVLDHMDLLLTANADPDALAEGLYEGQTNPPTSEQLDRFLGMLGESDLLDSMNAIRFVGGGANCNVLIPHIDPKTLNRAAVMLIENGGSPGLIARHADWSLRNSSGLLSELLAANVEPDALAESIARARDITVRDLDAFEATGLLPDMGQYVWSLDLAAVHERYAFLVAAGVPTELLDDRLEFAGIENDRP